MAHPTGFGVERFIARWQGGAGGQERSNAAMFLYELCEVLRVTPPEPAGRGEGDDYVFERPVPELRRDGLLSARRIDLYKRDCFVLEAKQVGQGRANPQGLIGPSNSRWNARMTQARAQAEYYVRLLPEGHLPPPFVIVCDVGYCFELYANFRRDGKAYGPFPDWVRFRIYVEDLLQPRVRGLLRAIWTEPLQLAPQRPSRLVSARTSYTSAGAG